MKSLPKFKLGQTPQPVMLVSHKRQQTCAASLPESTVLAAKSGLMHFADPYGAGFS